MKVKKKYRAVLIATLFVCSSAFSQQGPQLFGTPLKGATRDQLRQVLKKGGMVATREDTNYWVDIYDPGSVLEGARQFEVSYVAATRIFSDAEYTFPGDMDTDLVAKVIKMVKIKYGSPSSQSGNISLGPVSARWNLPNDMYIQVARGWPDTTTYLTYVDIKERRALEAEIAAETKKQANEQAVKQRAAF